MMQPRADRPGPGAVDTHATNAAPPDQVWRNLVRRGNSAFASGDHEMAARHYADAWLEAERLAECALAGDGDLFPVIGAVILVSGANLAEHAALAGDTVAAVAAADRALDRLIAILDDRRSEAALLQACLPHLAHALGECVHRLDPCDADRAEIDRRTATAKAAASRAAGRIETMH